VVGQSIRRDRREATLTTFIDQRTGRTTAKIGPNAIIQLVAAGKALGSEREMASVFLLAGEHEWLAAPPEAMVDERRVARVHRAVRAVLPAARASKLLADAGVRTADYLLAHRIPAPVKGLFRLTPKRLAARMLTVAISKHAWTFAGSGQFHVISVDPVIFEITGNPFRIGYEPDRSYCDWHLAVFSRLFQALVSLDIQARETACTGFGDPCCRFELAGARAVTRSGPDRPERRRFPAVCEG